MPVAPTLARPRVQLTYADSHTRACRRVGSQATADSLASYIDGTASWLSPSAPDGWKRLGQGVSRVALLGPDGWVYKCPLGTIGSDASQREAAYWDMALRHREFRPHVPHFRLFAVGKHMVIAMERLTVDRDRVNTPTAEDRKIVNHVRDMAEHIGCEDSHGGNLGWRGDHPLLLDAGGGTSREVMRSYGCGTCNPKHQDWVAE